VGEPGNGVPGLVPESPSRRQPRGPARARSPWSPGRAGASGAPSPCGWRRAVPPSPSTTPAASSRPGGRRRRAGGRAVAVQADLSQAAAVRRLFDAAFGRLDVLVNNAGVILSKLLVGTTEEEFDRRLAINVKGRSSAAGRRPGGRPTAGGSSTSRPRSRPCCGRPTRPTPPARGRSSRSPAPRRRDSGPGASPSTACRRGRPTPTAEGLLPSLTAGRPRPQGRGQGRLPRRPVLGPQRPPPPSQPPPLALQAEELAQRVAPLLQPVRVPQAGRLSSGPASMAPPAKLKTLNSDRIGGMIR
jgi:hypothetical protein